MTQIAVDGFNQMAAPFCSVVFFPSLGSWPSGICVAPSQEMGHKSALFIRNVALMGEKRRAHTKEDIPTGLTSGQMQRFGSHTSLSVVSSAIFLCTIFKKKMYSDKQEKKGLQMQK